MLSRLIWNKYTRSSVLWILAFFSPLKKGRITCVCWGGAKYNCNPKAITDTIIEKGLATKGKGPFEIVYAFINPQEFKSIIPEEIIPVEIGSLEYFYYLATSQFIIANTRLGGGIFWPFAKKKGQYYIQTQHGGHGIKKVEFDADLPEEYLKVAKEDTDRTDLMLSDSKYWTNVYRTGYRYKGEVLEHGLPRNDIFFLDGKALSEIKAKIYQYIYDKKGASVTDSTKLLIYAPTFRNNGRRDVYGFNVDKVVDALETKFGGTWYLLISSHPNMRSCYKEIYDFSHPRVIDVGLYPELQEFLVTSDALITDYSSAEMDYSLSDRPVFQLCKDRNDYDRGFYINPENLPFPYAETEDKLVQNILAFDEVRYHKVLSLFNEESIGSKETGRASEVVIKWMFDRVI